MRKKILPLLKCPENNQSQLKVYGVEVERNGNRLQNLPHNQIQDTDDIITGIIICESCQSVYPIEQAVAILLSRNDADHFHHIPLLESLKANCPTEYDDYFNETIQKLRQPSTTSDGIWNRDEMRYYDAAVETADKRGKMLEAIKTIPVHRIMIPRKSHITDIISTAINKSVILEIGCGNASTIYRILNPGVNHYQYIGSDISFKRLLVAKAAIPEGDFIQASALQLPFVNNSFNAIISFGMLHHLPRPVDAVSQVIPLIKKDGLFAFHEPIVRPAMNFPGLATLKKVMATYEHSEHDGKINLDEILKSLKISGFKIIHSANQISSIRSISETILKRINRKIMLNRQVVVLMENVDKIVLETLGKLTSKVGPKAVLVVLKKTID